jgi:hypothetical protein
MRIYSYFAALHYDFGFGFESDFGYDFGSGS